MLKNSVKMWPFPSQREGDAMAIRYAVDLTDTEHAALREIISQNKAKRSTIITAYIVLKPLGPAVGQTLTVLQRMKCPPKKSSSFRNVWSKKVLNLPCLANQSPRPTVETSPGTKKPI
jgi:hypothetical protein